MTENPVERGAAEEQADAPLTDTEVESSERPPSGRGESASEVDVEGGGE
jgi:hypothetical protein